MRTAWMPGREDAAEPNTALIASWMPLARQQHIIIDTKR